MDMNHQFLHRRQMGQIAPRYLGRRVGEDWLEVDYTFARTGGKQPLGEAAILGKRRGAANNVGHKDLMTIRTQYPYQTLRIWTTGEEPVMSLWICYTPVDAEQRQNRTFGLLSVRRPKIPGLLDAAWPVLVWFTERIFREDREIVEAEQAAHDAQGGDWNQEVFPPHPRPARVAGGEWAGDHSTRKAARHDAVMAGSSRAASRAAAAVAKRWVSARRRAAEREWTGAARITSASRPLTTMSPVLSGSRSSGKASSTAK